MNAKTKHSVILCMSYFKRAIILLHYSSRIPSDGGQLPKSLLTGCSSASLSIQRKPIGLIIFSPAGKKNWNFYKWQCRPKKNPGVLILLFLFGNLTNILFFFFLWTTGSTRTTRAKGCRGDSRSSGEALQHVATPIHSLHGSSLLSLIKPILHRASEEPRETLAHLASPERG